MKYDNMTYDEWDNHFNVLADDEGCVIGFDSHELTQDIIDRYGGGTYFWTEYDDGTISSGIQFVNRYRYLVTENPWNPNIVTIVESDAIDD